MSKVIVVFFVTLAVLLTSCSNTNSKPIVISINAWIGYSPLFYAREMGWLKEEQIELVSVVSLGESAHLFNAGSSDVFAGTQHEFFAQREAHSDLMPIMLLDKSYGGDMIMSNSSIEQLADSSQKVDVYLEVDSINHDLLNYFIAKHHIAKDRLIIHNLSQDEISLIKSSTITQPVIIVTYNPYNLELVDNGFKVIADTKSSKELFVVDAIYASSAFYNSHKDRFRQLDKIINRSLKALQDNPREYYEKVRVYLDNPSYEEFMIMNNNIVWLRPNTNQADIGSLLQIKFPIKDIVR